MTRFLLTIVSMALLACKEAPKPSDYTAHAAYPSVPSSFVDPNSGRAVEDLRPGDSGWICCLYLTSDMQFYVSRGEWPVEQAPESERSVRIGRDSDGSYWVTPPRGRTFQRERPDFSVTYRIHVRYREPAQ